MDKESKWETIIVSIVVIFNIAAITYAIYTLIGDGFENVAGARQKDIIDWMELNSADSLRITIMNKDVKKYLMINNKLVLQNMKYQLLGIRNSNTIGGLRFYILPQNISNKNRELHLYNNKLYDHYADEKHFVVYRNSRFGEAYFDINNNAYQNTNITINPNKDDKQNVNNGILSSKWLYNGKNNTYTAPAAGHKNVKWYCNNWFGNAALNSAKNKPPRGYVWDSYSKPKDWGIGRKDAIGFCAGDFGKGTVERRTNRYRKVSGDPDKTPQKRSKWLYNGKNGNILPPNASFKQIKFWCDNWFSNIGLNRAKNNPPLGYNWHSYAEPKDWGVKKKDVIGFCAGDFAENPAFKHAPEVNLIKRRTNRFIRIDSN